jgi:xanthine dehydrogenase accessory factor
MHWVAAVERLRRERRAGILVTVSEVRGHAPREAGAKMVVALPDPASDAPSRTHPAHSWGTVGGGNL